MNKKFIKTYNDIINFPTLQSVANKLELSERTVRRKAKALKDAGEDLIDRRNNRPPESMSVNELKSQVEARQLQDKIRVLNKQLQEAHKEVSTSQEIKDLIHEVNSYKPEPIPGWLNKSKAKNADSLTGIPVLFLSDIHFDEVVFKEQIGGVNEFNREIAEKRIEYTFDTARKLTKEYMDSPNYDGIVLALGGDMLTGIIHEELAETNAAPVLDSVIRLAEILITGVEMLANEFGKVFVPCVVGNHGRLRQQKRFKNKVQDNYEYIMYHYIEKHFRNDNRVTVSIPMSHDIQFNIYDTKFLLEHGDAFRGGNGIAGVFSPLMLGAHRRNKNKTAVNKPFDIMMIGHFHQYVHTNSLIVNGSVKGFDEYSSGNNYSYEPPQQALFIVHPTYGVTFRMPIRCDGYELEDKKSSNKVKIVF